MLKTFITEYKNIFIVENLCPTYLNIFNECKKLKTAGKIARLWTWNGVVHYKLTENRNERGTKNFHMDDLHAQFADEIVNNTNNNEDS